MCSFPIDAGHHRESCDKGCSFAYVCPVVCDVAAPRPRGRAILPANASGCPPQEGEGNPAFLLLVVTSTLVQSREVALQSLVW